MLCGLKSIILCIYFVFIGGKHEAEERESPQITFSCATRHFKANNL